MPFVEFSSVKHRVTVGVPLPFHVRNADQTLLLARGQVIASERDLLMLLQRGTLVDSMELAASAPPRQAIWAARVDQLPGLLRTAMARAALALSQPPTAEFAAVVEAVADPLMAIVERDPDLAIFQVLRQEGNYLTQYGVNHSIHCAITVFLVATRFGWSESEVRRGFRAALTMNLAMLELQGQLATQVGPLTDAQRDSIERHPQESIRMLEAGGITDPDWLRAVRHHHQPDDAAVEANELAGLLSRADIYTAKLSPRRNREALGADVAARMVFAADRSHPATAAIVKEFGIYPPGCHVKLANGETGIVVRRGELAHTPWVAATTNAQGMALPEPLRRDTSQRLFNVTAVLRNGAGAMRFAPEVMQRLAHA